ncbi:MAG: acyl-CoA synthetase [Erythrobacter sp.]|uniref:acyl-CoA synthetase n=1 Tax=Erythrobacter sp. TaxID=1042 RepID=UPI003A896694
MISAELPSHGPAFGFDWIATAADRTPDNLAQIDIASSRRFTYAQMNTRVGALAAHLRLLGIAKGDRVAYLMMNSSDVFEVIFACWRIGAVAVALNWRLTGQELAFIAEDAGPKVLIHDRGLGELASAIADMPCFECRIETASDGSESDYERAIAGSKSLAWPDEPPLLSDICMLMYSSGTTGRPKGVVITHQMQLLNAWGTIADASIGTSSTSLCFMPLFHIAGVNGVIGPCFLAGACVAIVRTFDPGKVLGLIDDPELGVTHFVAVPAIYQAMLAHPQSEATDFSRIVTSFVGASSVPLALLEGWKARGLRLREGYGLTESAGAGVTMPAHFAGEPIEVSGKASHSFELKVVDDEGQEASLGELWMRGPCITPGYWNRPEANRESFVDGWFRTGDVVSRDEEGFYKIQDRLKDMYISGGENVYPAEVEDAIYARDDIAEVAVIGLPDERWGEIGCAVVVPKQGADIGLDDLRAGLEGRLARYKLPARIELVESLPRTASGKVKKNELRELFSREDAQP